MGRLAHGSTSLTLMIGVSTGWGNLSWEGLREPSHPLYCHFRVEGLPHGPKAGRTTCQAGATNDEKVGVWISLRSFFPFPKRCDGCCWSCSRLPQWQSSDCSNERGSDVTEKIEKLTDAQVAAMPMYAEAWIAHGLSTELADRPAAEAGAKLAYEAADLEAPGLFLWLGSPYAGAVAAALLADEGARDLIQREAMNRAWRSLQARK